VLLRNLRARGQAPGDVRFQDVSEQGGGYFDGVHRGRGAAFGDLDNDGRIDVVLSHCNEPAALLRNIESSGHRWLGVRLQGKTNRDAVGAVIKLEVDGQTLSRCVKGGGSYLSANDPRIVFGLRKASAVGKLTVRWPSGKTQEWSGADLGIDRYVLLTEDDRAVRLALTKAKS
jgi:enediyne biosynthesis protein E4